jgi:hypothetical protein
MAKAQHEATRGHVVVQAEATVEFEAATGKVFSMLTISVT